MRSFIALATLFFSLTVLEGHAQKRAKHVSVVGFDGFGAHTTQAPS